MYTPFDDFVKCMIKFWVPGSVPLGGSMVDQTFMVLWLIKWVLGLPRDG